MVILVQLMHHLLLHELSVERSLAVLGHGHSAVPLGPLLGLLLPLPLLVPLVDQLRDLPLPLLRLRLHDVLVLALTRTHHVVLVRQHVLVIRHVLQLLLSVHVYVLYVLFEALALLAVDLVVFELLVLEALVELLPVVVLLVPIHDALHLERPLRLLDPLALPLYLQLPRQLVHVLPVGDLRPVEVRELHLVPPRLRLNNLREVPVTEDYLRWADCGGLEGLQG